MQPSHAFPTDVGQPLMLSKEQQAIVASTAHCAIMAALAGTGKTTTLACCALQALRQQPQARILVLAYTKAGVQAFQHRWRSLSQHVPAQLQVTTLERWCARHLRQRDPQVRFLTDPVALREHAQQAWQGLQEQQQWQPDERLEFAANMDMQAFMDFAQAAKKSLMLQRMHDDGYELAEFCDVHGLDYTLARWFTAAERLRIDRCGDTLFYAEGDCTYALAQTDGEPLQAPYDLVLFDEMHDLDLASLTVLRRLLTGSEARFLGAGDFHQHIEAQAWSVFQDKLHQLQDFLPVPAVGLPLTVSRRFGNPIAQAVNDWLNVGMQATSARRSTVTRWQYADDAECIAQVLQAQSSLPKGTHGSAPPLSVILRHPHDATALHWAIHDSGKSASLHGLQPFYLHREIALLLGLMYAHSMQAPDWKAQTCILDRDILAVFIDAALYFGQGRIHAPQAQSELLTMASQMHAYPQGIWRFLLGEQHLQGGKRNLAAFGQFVQLPLSLQNDASALLQQADVQALFASTPMPADQTQALQAQLRSFLQVIEGMSVPQVLQRVAAMATRHQQTVQWGRGFDFQLLSIEQAKGQEFEAVALPFLSPGRFPAPCPHATAFLERNRLYVAMTRAQQRLWLLESAQHPIQPL